jgi:hypothetical protein
VTLAYNLIYTGDRDQEDCNSKPAQANSLWDTYLEITHHKKKKKDWWSNLWYRSWVQAPVPQKTRKKKEKYQNTSHQIGTGKCELFFYCFYINFHVYTLFAHPSPPKQNLLFSDFVEEKTYR